MKFIITHKDFSTVLSRLQNVISVKPPIPILANILIEAEGDSITLTATDLLVGVRYTCPAKVLEPGATTLPARYFVQLIKELTAHQIEVTKNENELTEIVAGSSCFKVLGMGRTEYPTLPNLENAHTFEVAPDILKNALYRTAFAVSREDNRYVLTGVSVQFHKGKAILTGTDAKRLARAQLETDLDPSIQGNYIVPLKAVEEILKNLSDSDTPVKVYLMDDKIAIEQDQMLLISKLLTGEYPDVSRVIPESQQVNLPIHREELMTLLRQMVLFTNEENQSIRFSFTNGELKLAANTADVGEGRVSMPVNYQGEKIDIAFNPSYLLDILKHTKEETINVGLIDSFNPGLITEGSEVTKPGAANPLFVIMPMRLHEV